MTAKTEWQMAANTLNQRQNRTGRHKITPANTYVTLNSARMACGLSILTDAPADLHAPPMLPAVAVHSSATDTNDAFTLCLVSPGYNCAVLVLAAAPTPGGKTTFPDNAFKPIGALPRLDAGTPSDIAALYKAAYGTPEPGSQIALKLIATSPAGIRACPLLCTGIVSLAPAAAAIQEDLSRETELPLVDTAQPEAMPQSPNEKPALPPLGLPNKRRRCLPLRPAIGYTAHNTLPVQKDRPCPTTPPCASLCGTKPRPMPPRASTLAASTVR